MSATTTVALVATMTVTMTDYDRFQKCSYQHTFRRNEMDVLWVTTTDGQTYVVLARWMNSCLDASRRRRRRRKASKSNLNYCLYMCSCVYKQWECMRRVFVIKENAKAVGVLKFFFQILLYLCDFYSFLHLHVYLKWMGNVTIVVNVF